MKEQPTPAAQTDGAPRENLSENLNENLRKNLRKTRVGLVVSDKMDKSIVVSTVTRVPHPKFGKIIKVTKKFHAHDEENKAKVGDKVRIAETRPLSRLKRWRLVEVLSH